MVGVEAVDGVGARVAVLHMDRARVRVRDRGWGDKELGCARIRVNVWGGVGGRAGSSVRIRVRVIATFLAASSAASSAARAASSAALKKTAAAFG